MVVGSGVICGFAVYMTPWVGLMSYSVVVVWFCVYCGVVV